MTVPSVAPTVIAYRKACQPAGTGLSHYVLVTNTAPHLDASSETNLR
ncbi:MAG: modified peptide precursor CbpA [Actinomycetota bacterium]|jgi:modified peptide precursor CbpA|nr:modified peptide precursor CbpA [Actinomycetota bacterium]